LTPAAAITYPVQFGDESSLQKGAKVAFRFYKKFVSSQDVQACNFHPSCSVYALQAIEKKGMINGFLLTFDRLTRCHPLGAVHYDRHPENGLFLDPVD
jgi:putative membrane protein insertion efficiency factor